MVKPLRFMLKVPNTKQWFWVIVHPTLKELRTAATAHSRDWEDAKISYNKAYGCTHSYSRTVIARGGAQKDHPNIGIIRLSRGYLSPSIVVHELVHAAAHIYRLRNHDRIHISDMAQEEKLAYIVSDLWHDMNTKLHDKQLWT